MTQRDWFAKSCGFVLAQSALCAGVAAGGLLVTPGAAAAAEGGGRVIEEIVVTATRREAGVQEVPLSITAASGDTIERRQINDLEELSALVPGLQLTSGVPGQVNPQFRGSRVDEDSPGVEMPIAVFVDEIYHGSAAAMVADLYDVDTVEVLAGPQGTTFGRNVTGGVIRIRNNKPDMEENSGQVALTMVDNPGVKAEGHVNRVFSDTTAGRLSFYSMDYDGDIKNTVTGHELRAIKRWSARGQLRFQPRDDLDILFSTSYSRDTTAGIARKAVPTTLPDQVPFSSQPDLFAPYPGYPISSSTDKVEIDEDGTIDRKAWNAILSIDWETGLGTFTSITTGRGFKLNQVIDIEASALPLLPDKNDLDQEDQFTQEFRLVSPTDETLEWILGVYFLRQDMEREERNRFDLGILPGTILAGLQPGYTSTVTYQQIDVTSIAPYAEVSWHLNEQFTAFAGGRYTWDKKEGVTRHSGDPNIFTGQNFDADLNAKFHQLTPRVGIQFRPTDDILLFATASKGFKSGGFTNNAPSPEAASEPFREETVWSYELGAKTTWLDNRLVANLTLYQADTKDLQVRVFSDTGFFVFGNAGKSQAKGLDFMGTAVLTDNVQVDAMYGYMKGEFKDFTGCTGAGADCSGLVIPDTPKHSLQLGAELFWSVPSLGGSMSARAEYQFRSKTYLQNTNDSLASRALTEQERFNLFVNYRSDDELWQISLWGRNLTDESYMASGGNDFSSFFLSLPERLAGKEVQIGTVSGARVLGATFTRNF